VHVRNHERELFKALAPYAHKPEQCAGQICVLHNPAEGAWRDCTVLWRGDRGIFERLCEHRCGHPDPSQYAFWESTGQEWQLLHGCDGCCEGWYAEVMEFSKDL
jgi:hypothetical protein